MSDLPRLAEGTGAEGFSGVQKLLKVKISNGWVNGELPKGSDAEHWWSPWEEYYADPENPPFLPLLKRVDSEHEVITFLESFGSIVEGHLGSDRSRIRFPVALFHFEKWQFRFLLSLFNHKDSKECRRLFLEHLNLAGQSIQNPALQRAHGKWKEVVREISEATQRAGAPILHSVQIKVSKMESADIERAAHFYITTTITDRIRNLPLACEVRPGGVRLFAYCDDLLPSFYWMLADYFARPDHGRISKCAACGRVFIGRSKYCPDRPECKERGRRRLDWDRNKEKYNRNRKRKRRLAKRAN